MLFLWSMAQNRKVSSFGFSSSLLVQRAFQINHPLLTPVNEVRFTWDTYPITPYLPYNPMPCFKYYSFVLLNNRCCQIFEMQSFYMTYVLFSHLLSGIVLLSPITPPMNLLLPRFRNIPFV